MFLKPELVCEHRRSVEDGVSGALISDCNDTTVVAFALLMDQPEPPGFTCENRDPFVEHQYNKMSVEWYM